MNPTKEKKDEKWQPPSPEVGKINRDKYLRLLRLKRQTDITKEKLNEWRDDIGYLKIIWNSIPDETLYKNKIAKSLTDFGTYIEDQKRELIQAEAEKMIEDAG
jgi:gas vesicle protein